MRKAWISAIHNDCSAHSSDPYFAQQSMDLLRIPWIVRSVATLRKVWIKQMGFCFILKSRLKL